MDKKKFILDAVDSKKDKIIELSDRIFDFAETGFHEFRSAELFEKMLREEGFTVETGIFGADMKIELLNDGPVTIWLDSDAL